ncbi:MAG: hypothetical protein QWI36_04705 [Wolbachia endosymbiont of Tyrophagus putrescentiae]|nr:hypothetical protein [Wolbachia endosymbiont of Tyrophagus putrescentiae]
MAEVSAKANENSQEQLINLLINVAQSQNKSVLKLLTELMEEEIEDIELSEIAGKRYKEERIRHQDVFWD